jgi:hypothetical protein
MAERRKALQISTEYCLTYSLLTSRDPGIYTLAILILKVLFLILLT